MKNKNKSLFWYGLRARLMKLIGVILFPIAIFAFFSNVIYGVIIFIIGISLIVIGAQNEFDYKRQGGYIIYND